VSKDSFKITFNVDDFNLSDIDSVSTYCKNLKEIYKTECKTYESSFDTGMTGKLFVKEGYILYLDSKFIISKGIVKFTHPDCINPIIAIQGETQLKRYQTLEHAEYRIVIQIQGQLHQIKIKLRSTPQLARSDIIALLAIGSTRKYLIEKENEQNHGLVNYIVKDRLVLQYGDKITGYTTDKMSAFLGLDKMRITGDLSEFRKSTGPQLLASKRISERAEIIYTTKVGHLNEQSIRLDYKLSKYFSFEGQTDQQGRSDIDLKYRLRFK
jgi:hypothetical protein